MAVAAYFQILRNHRRTPDGGKLTQTVLAEMVAPYLPHRKVDQTTISKAETGADAINGDLMSVLLTVLGGRVEDVVWLFGKTDPEDGRRKALEALAAEIPSENELDRLIADWQADEEVRRSLRRAWSLRSAGTASGREDRE